MGGYKMEDKCISVLKEWFGNLEFEYVVIKSTEDECIFLTIHAGGMCTDKNFRELELYRVFKVGDVLEISDHRGAGFVINNDFSILKAIEDVIKLYEDVQ